MERNAYFSILRLNANLASNVHVLIVHTSILRVDKQVVPLSQWVQWVQWCRPWCWWWAPNLQQPQCRGIDLSHTLRSTSMVLHQPPRLRILQSDQQSTVLLPSQVLLSNCVMQIHSARKGIVSTRRVSICTKHLIINSEYLIHSNVFFN